MDIALAIILIGCALIAGFILGCIVGHVCAERDIRTDVKAATLMLSKAQAYHQYKANLRDLR
jgi:uncharacterized protein YneF (UPF0154 family)